MPPEIFFFFFCKIENEPNGSDAASDNQQGPQLSPWLEWLQGIPSLARPVAREFGHVEDARGQLIVGEKVGSL